MLECVDDKSDERRFFHEDMWLIVRFLSTGLRRGIIDVYIVNMIDVRLMI